MVSLKPAPILAAGTFLLSAAWIAAATRRKALTIGFALVSVMSIGATLYTLESRDFNNHPLRRLASADYLDFKGVLQKSPGREIDRDVLRLRTESVRRRKEEPTLGGRLRIAVPCPPGSHGRLRLHAGDRILVSARLSSLRTFQNFGAFSYDSYLQTQKIHRSGSTKTRLLVEKIEGGPFFSPVSFFSRVRSALQEKLESEFPSAEGKSLSDEGAVLEALLLGEDGRMSPSIVHSLQATGLYHLFAISGGHIAIITFLLFSLLRLVRLNQRTSSAVLIVFLVFYTLLVEASPSVLRATFMTLAFLGGRLLWKDVHILNTIAASVFVLLLANPFSLFEVGFQLTYAATLAIILFHPRLMKLLPELPLKFGEMTALSVSAMAGVLPIIVRSFNRVTFSSLLLNYAAIPLTGLIMGLGYVYLPLAFLIPDQARLLARILKMLVLFFIWISHVFDSIHFLSYRIPTPDGVTVAGYYIFLALALSPRRFRGQRLLLAGGFACFFFILIFHPFHSSSEDLKVTMIDVGQGESLLVEFPGRETMLIDGGGFPESSFDVGDKVVSSFLWRKGIRRLDYLVLTHPHPDHLNGLVSVAANFRIGEYWEAFSSEGNSAYEALQDMLGGRTQRRRVFRGFRHSVGNVLVEALHPGPCRPTSTTENDLSLVLRISLGDAAFLLGADIGASAEREILEKYGSPAATVLKVPHHGSRTSSSPPFLEGVGPEVVLLSLGARNLFGFPHREVLDRLRKAEARVWRTDLHGSVEVATDGCLIRIRTGSGETDSFSLRRLTPPVK